MFIEPFKVEIWMNEWETRCTHNLAETCVASITIQELLSLAGLNESALSDLLPMKLTYGDIEGSTRLRAAIAALYETQAIEDITVTHGTIAANMLVHKALVGPGDRVISVVPTYQQHYSIPASIGAQVTTLRLREEDHFLPDLDHLRELATGETKLIAFTNPNNPTGTITASADIDGMIRLSVMARGGTAGWRGSSTRSGSRASRAVATTWRGRRSRCRGCREICRGRREKIRKTELSVL